MTKEIFHLTMCLIDIIEFLSFNETVQNEAVTLLFVNVNFLLKHKDSLIKTTEEITQQKNGNKSMKIVTGGIRILSIIEASHSTPSSESTGFRLFLEEFTTKLLHDVLRDVGCPELMPKN